MIFEKAELEEVSLKFASPFETANNWFDLRAIWLLKLTFSGAQYLGEISPLSGFSNEGGANIATNFNALQRVLHDAEKIESTNELFGIADTFDAYPAFRSGIEQALLQAYASQHCTSPGEIFGVDAPLKYLPLNATVGLIELPQLNSALDASIAEGFTCVKLKVGRKYLADDIKLVNDAFAGYGDLLTIRLDANRCWTYDQAITFFHGINHLPVEYIEEPVTDFAEFKALRNFTHIPLAADESITDLQIADSILAEDYADVLIIKPGILGGIKPSLELIARAKAAGKKATITSSLDSPIGKRKAVVTAALAQTSSPAGLDTIRFFENAIYNDMYPVAGARIYCDNLQF